MTSAQTEKDLGLQEVQVIDSFIPVVPSADKLMDIPQLVDTIKLNKNIIYSPLNKYLKGRLKLNSIKAATIKGEPLSNLYKSYIYGGFGNMSMPTSKIHINSDRNKTLSYALLLSYKKSYADVKSIFDENQKVSASFRETDFSAFLKKDFEPGIVNAFISRQGHMFRAYGYNPSLNLSKESVEEYWGYSKAIISFQSKNKYNNRPLYYAKLFACDLNEKIENSLSLFLSAKQKIGLNEYNFGLEIDYEVNNLSDKYVFADSLVKELIITFNPSLKRELWSGNLNFGFDLVSMDARDSSNIKLAAFPQLTYDYIFSENNLSASFGITSGLDKNTYWSLSKKNPFVLNALTDDGDGLNLINSKVLYDFYIGMNAYLGNDIHYSSNLSYSSVQDMSFFELDLSSIYQNKFKVVYDDVRYLQWSSKLDFKINRRSNLSTALNYHKYNVDSLRNYAYKPMLTSRLEYNYNIGDKIFTQLDIMGAFKRSTAIDSSSLAPILNDIIDVNLSLEYKYSAIFSAYLKAENLIGGYQIWQNYPVLGPQVFFGLSFRF